MKLIVTRFNQRMHNFQIFPWGEHIPPNPLNLSVRICHHNEKKFGSVHMIKNLETCCLVDKCVLFKHIEYTWKVLKFTFLQQHQ